MRSRISSCPSFLRVKTATYVLGKSRGEWIRKIAKPSRAAEKIPNLELPIPNLEPSQFTYYSEPVAINTDQYRDKLGASGLIIFDGSCGLCSTFVGERQKFFEHHGFRVTPLQEEWVVPFTGLSETVLMQAIHVVTPEGEVFKRAEFFAFVASRIWWAKPVAFLLRLPFAMRIFTKLYNLVARNRQQISKTCGLSSRARYR